MWSRLYPLLYVAVAICGRYAPAPQQRDKRDPAAEGYRRVRTVLTSETRPTPLLFCGRFPSGFL